MKIDFNKDYLKTNICTDIKEIEYFLKGKFEKNKTFIISFDDIIFDTKDINFTQFFKSLPNIENLTFTFNNTIFNSHISFDKLECKKLIFYKTTFCYGGSFKKSIITKIIYFPKKLNSDVIFDKCNVKFFKYKNQSIGDGFTRFYDIVFGEKADFRKTILDKVHFENQNMENIYLLESKVDKTLFENCEFILSNIQLKHKIYNTNRYIIIIFASIISFFISLLFIMLNFIPFFQNIFNSDEDKFIIISTIITTLLSFIFYIVFMKIFFSTSHLLLADEKKLNKSFKVLENYIKKIISLYNSLYLNFKNRENYIYSNEFFYTKKYLEIFYTKKVDLIYSSYFLLNFGHKWYISIFLFLITLLAFSSPFYTSIDTKFIQKYNYIIENRDYISTENTPIFLLYAHNKKFIFKEYMTYDYKNKAINSVNFSEKDFLLINKIENYELNENSSRFYGYNNIYDFKYKEQYVPMLKNSWITRFYYSLSHIVLPFVPDNKKWFEKRTHKAVLLGIMETSLLWLFLITFIVSMKNRIKR